MHHTQNVEVRESKRIPGAMSLTAPSRADGQINLLPLAPLVGTEQEGGGGLATCLSQQGG